MKSLPCKPNARPLVSFTLFVSVMRNSLMLELWHQGSVRHAEDAKERTHDGRGTGDDDPGHDPHLAVGIAFRHANSAAPDFNDAPEKPEEEQDPQPVLKRGLEGRGNLREWHHRQCPRLTVQQVELNCPTDDSREFSQIVF